MSTVTTVFGLTKPAGIEQFSLATYNNNLDLIDAAILSEAHKIQHIEFVRQGHVAGTGAVGIGDMSTLIESATSKNYSTWITFPAVDQVNISQEGIYAFQWKIVPNTTVTFWHSMYTSSMGGGEVGRSQNMSVTASDAYYTYSPNFYVPTGGQTITFKFSLAAAVTINHRLKITKVK